MLKILLAVNYFHQKLILHNDLDISDILLSNDSDLNTEIKILNFGIATKYGTKYDELKNSYDSYKHAWSYTAPEVLLFL